MTMPQATPRRARDVMAFGQEAGRVLSDGRIVGRAEPFAKVFQSSRMVKQAVGLTAWGILEDIALDATLDAEGRLVAETNTRRIAANLGLNKETVGTHLARLREFGFVLHEEVRHRGSGRYETARYVLDPSACIERFTSTPRRPVAEDLEGAPSRGVPGSVRTGRGEPGPPETVTVVRQAAVVAPQPQTVTDASPLLQLGVDADTAAALAARYSPTRVREVADAALRRARRNPAGWAIRALQGDWTVTRPHDPNPDAHRRPPPAVLPVDEGGPDHDTDRGWQDWDRAISAALDDQQLADAVALTSLTLPAGSRVGPTLRVQLIRWAAHTQEQAGTQDLSEALAAALANPVSPAIPLEPGRRLPTPPVAAGGGRPLRERIAALIPAAQREGGRP